MGEAKDTEARKNPESCPEKLESGHSTGAAEKQPSVRRERSISHVIESSPSGEFVQDNPTAFLYFCTLVAAMGPFAFGYALGYTSPTLDAMSDDLKLSTTGQSIFSSIISVGAMIGAMVGGRVADMFGRRAAFAMAAVPFSIGWGMIAFSHDPVVLCTGRILSGFGTGVVSLAVPVYIAEIAPRNLRGPLGSVTQLGITLGLFTVYLMGSIVGWRALACVGIYAPMLLLVGLAIVPESPRWLARWRSKEELHIALHRLRGAKVDISQECKEIQKSIEASEALPRANFSHLTAPELRRPLVVGIGLMILQQLSGVNAVMFYAGPIFTAVGFTNSNLPSIFLQAVQVVVTMVASGLLYKYGRRSLLMLSGTCLAVACFTLGGAFWLQTATSLIKGAEILAFSSLVVYVVAFCLGLGPIPWIIMSEIFPSHVRDLAGSLAVLANWMTSFLVTFSFEALIEANNVYTFWGFAFNCLILVIFVIILVPETQGRTLEEIEEFFRKPIAPQLP
eukprot:TRINITY_DN29446_c0_g1_i1.p1 TRINITY_DN29446_c0_g1~~TRINITY_DN29446_c0_g1_i1.p1  ORF type:complete len:506 (+),score=113.86 TRINITY_DN29446_c0_g1_i1:311-1828(+)